MSALRIEIWKEDPPNDRSLYPFERIQIGEVFKVVGLDRWEYLRQRASKLKAEGKGEWTVRRAGNNVKVYRVG